MPCESLWKTGHGEFFLRGGCPCPGRAGSAGGIMETAEGDGNLVSVHVTFPHVPSRDMRAIC